MVSKQVTVVNAQGFHMRPAGMFAKEMGTFPCEVTIRFNDKNVNAKSLMNLIAACIKCGSQIEIICDGQREQEALDKAVEMVESGLGE